MKKPLHCKEAAPRLELGMKDLQSSALPLGYAAVTQESIASMSRCVKKMLTARRFGDKPFMIFLA